MKKWTRQKLMEWNTNLNQDFGKSWQEPKCHWKKRIPSCFLMITMESKNLTTTCLHGGNIFFTWVSSWQWYMHFYTMCQAHFRFRKRNIKWSWHLPLNKRNWENLRRVTASMKIMLSFLMHLKWLPMENKFMLESVLPAMLLMVEVEWDPTWQMNIGSMEEVLKIYLRL